MTRNTGSNCVTNSPVWLARLLPCSTELVLLVRGWCLEILLMFIGMGGVEPAGRSVGLLASCPVLPQCLFLPASKKWLPEFCQDNLTECWRVTCEYYRHIQWEY